jgi:hypothetical protein
MNSRTKQLLFLFRLGGVVEASSEPELFLFHQGHIPIQLLQSLSTFREVAMKELASR